MKQITTFILLALTFICGMLSLHLSAQLIRRLLDWEISDTQAVGFIAVGGVLTVISGILCITNRRGTADTPPNSLPAAISAPRVASPNRTKPEYKKPKFTKPFNPQKAFRTVALTIALIVIFATSVPFIIFVLIVLITSILSP